MSKPHTHADLIKAWADGEAIQFAYDPEGTWKDIETPAWAADVYYRIKPEPKPDIVLLGWVQADGSTSRFVEWSITSDNLKLTFDGETSKLKSAEVLA
jgi:hypothetical protein